VGWAISTMAQLSSVSWLGLACLSRVISHHLPTPRKHVIRPFLTPCSFPSGPSLFGFPYACMCSSLCLDSL
jgi:hypothetical protein